MLPHLNILCKSSVNLHNTKITVHLSRNTADPRRSLLEFTELANSPKNIEVDFAVWGTLQQKLRRQNIKTSITRYEFFQAAGIRMGTVTAKKSGRVIRAMVDMLNSISINIIKFMISFDCEFFLKYIKADTWRILLFCIVSFH